MSIKPIDSQVILQGTPKAAKQQSIDNNKNANVLAQAAESMQKKAELDTERVSKTAETEKSKIHKKEDKDNSEQKKKKKNNSNNNNEGSTIDIRV